MRWIAKPAHPPAAISEYLAAQAPVGHGLDYPTFASTPGRARQLRDELIRQQGGLCAYTGAGIDHRLGMLKDPNRKLKFGAHNEHLKPQSVCRAELAAQGHVPGEFAGEDMDHHNIVAALLVEGAERVSQSELFGASRRGDNRLDLLPTDRSCEARLRFLESGEVAPSSSADAGAGRAIQVLDLGNQKLNNWRAQAISAFIDGIQTRTDAEDMVHRLQEPVAGWLPEYCFAIRQVIQRMLAGPATPSALKAGTPSASGNPPAE